MNETTFGTIERISNERIRLWRLAGKGQATDRDRERIGQITTQLEVLWDTYRREVASDQRGYMPPDQRGINRYVA